MAVPQSPLPDPQYRAPSLAFSVSSSSQSTNSQTRARTGQLTFNRAEIDGDSGNDAAVPGRQIDTPAMIAYTSRGAIPHLTRDNVARLPNEMVHLSFEHLMDLPTPAFPVAPFSLHRFIGLHETKNQRSQILTAALRDFWDPVELPPAVDPGVIANTLRGAVKVTPSDFLEMTLARPPDILFAFGDDDISRPSNKRTEKSVRRSLKWVREVSERAHLRTNVFAPLIGDDNISARAEYANALLGTVSSRATAGAALEEGEKPVDHFVCGYTLLQPRLPSSLEQVAALFNASLENLRSDKPRIGLRVAGPHAILRLVRDVGLDLFVDEWSSRCASIGVGLDFEFPVSTTTPNHKPKSDIGHSFFDMQFVEAFVPLSTLPLAQPDPDHANPFGSEAPTRGYVHHLLHAHEMTAHVILALHNNIVMHNFFASIRRLIARNDGSFEAELERFFERYEDCPAPLDGQYPCVVEAKVGWQIVNKERGKGSLKDKRTKDLVEALAPVDTTERMALQEETLKIPLER